MLMEGMNHTEPDNTYSPPTESYNKKGYKMIFYRISLAAESEP